MATPSIQTLITQAQQVLNLQSSNEIRATLAAVLANANVGTPLNPNLTTQQLWDEFDEIVRQSTDDIMSIIVDQMMRMVFSPPAPGGAGADKQVIFNDMGVLAGDSKFLWDKTANRLDVDGPVVITGALTVDTTTLVANAAGYADRVGIGTATPSSLLALNQASGAYSLNMDGGAYGTMASFGIVNVGVNNNSYIGSVGNNNFLIQVANSTRATFDLNGHFNLANGNVVMTTPGTGIDFSATSSVGTSELLNDYEEGTWTGTLKGSTTDPTIAVTATGRYTKIGRQVYVQIHFSGVNTTGASGAVSITGLPFANNASIASQGSILSDNALTFTGSPFVFVDVNASTFLIYQSTSNASASACTHNAGTARYLYANLTYTVA